MVSHNRIENKDGLSTLYPYTDRDIDVFLKCLRKKNKIEFEISGVTETGISIDQNQITIELPAISSANTSPIAPRILEQIDHLNNLNLGESKPIKIIAPYKLSNSWHWNILEINLETLTNNKKTASCKRYNTDGNSYPVEENILVGIKKALNAKNYDEIKNQQSRQAEYAQGSIQDSVNCGLASAIIMHDLRLNKKDYCEQGENLTKPNFDKDLRMYAYDIVNKYGEDHDTKTFCKEINQDEFIDPNSHPDPDHNLKLEVTKNLAPIIQDMSDVDKNLFTEASEILSNTEGKGSDAYQKLRDITNDKFKKLIFNDKDGFKDRAIDAITSFSDAQSTIAQPTKPQKIPAPQGPETTPEYILEQDEDLERGRNESLGTYVDETLRFFRRELHSMSGQSSSDQQLSNEISDLRAKLENALGTEYGDGVRELFALGASTIIKEKLSEKVKSPLDDGANINHQDKSGFTPSMSATLDDKTDIAKPLLDGGADPAKTNKDSQSALQASKRKDEKNGSAKKPEAPNQKETKEPPESSNKKLPEESGSTPKLNSLEESIIKEHKSKSSREIASIISGHLEKEAVDSTNTMTKEFADPRSYSGIGANIEHNYNTAKRQFEFKITEVFAGGLAAKMGLKIGQTITYQSDDNSISSLKEAISDVRSIAILRENYLPLLKLPPEKTDMLEKISIVNSDKEPSRKGISLITDSVMSSTSLDKKINIFIHDGSTCNKDGFVKKIEATKTKKPSPKPSTSPEIKSISEKDSGNPLGAKKARLIG